MFEAAILLVMFGLVAVFLFRNRHSFFRIFGVGEAQLDKRSKEIANLDPIAMMQKRIDEGYESLGRYAEGVKSAAGDIKSLTRQIEFSEKNIAVGEARLNRAITDKKKDAEKSAALYLSNESQHLEENKRQLEVATKEHQKGLEDIQTTQQLLQNLEQEAQHLNMSLTNSRRRREIREMMGSFNKDFGIQAIKQFAEVARTQIDQNDGAAETQELLNQGSNSSLDRFREEQQEKADSFLEEYKRKKNLV